MKRNETVKKAQAAKPPARRGTKVAAKPKSKPKAKTAPKSKPAPAKRKVAQPDMLDAMLAASAEALNLRINPEWRDGVRFNLGLILRLGALVDSFALPDDTEPGPVFHA
jgi:hypothetical protein